MREHKYPIQYQLKFSCDYVRSIVTRSVLFVGIQILTLLFIGYHPLLYGMILGPTVLYYLIDFMRMPRCIEIYQERIVIRRNVGRTVIRNIRISVHFILKTLNIVCLLFNILYMRMDSIRLHMEWLNFSFAVQTNWR